MDTNKHFNNPRLQPGENERQSTEGEPGKAYGKPALHTHPDHLLFLTDEELSSTEYATLREHLATCPTCCNTRESALLTRKQILASILAEANAAPAVDYRDQPDNEIHSILTRIPSESKPLKLIRLVSSAAAILLLLIFIAEQARSVQQISNLEKRLSNLEYPGTSHLIDQWTLYRVSHNWQDLAERYELSDTQLATLGSLNPSRLAQYQEVIDKMIRLEITRRQSLPKNKHQPTPNPK
ncbi:MAG: zf-HC2 domain-containing protein [Bacteroidales bacterium]